MRFVKPKKALGQHFLNDISIAERIVESLSPSQNVLEIGPGTGILTKILIKKKIDLKLVEIDKESVDFLTNELEINDSLIYNQDFLKMNLDEVFNKNNFSIIGNFPYNISSQIVFKIIDYRKYIPEMCGMFQYEVAERICSNFGSKKYGILSVLIQAFFNVKLLKKIKPESFNPIPKVYSAVIRITKKTNNINCDENLFKKIVKLSFGQRRKTLWNSLKALNIPQIKKEDTIFAKRPEQLSVADFIYLTNLVSNENI